MNVSDSKIIHKRLYELNKAEQFERFDMFITKKVWENEKGRDISFEPMSKERKQRLQKEAYLNFYRKVKAENVASRVTIKKWFGLNGYVRPKREHIFKLAFALTLDEEELQEYLIKGIRQPGIQINDYREMIYLYGLERALSYEDCVDMIRAFEVQMYRDTVFAQSTHTQQLWNMYRKNCNQPKEKFLSWMCKNAGFFKGYSKVALKHFMEVKSEALKYIRLNAKESLFEYLAETDFPAWAKQNGIAPEEYGENISRYLKNMSRRKERGELAETLKANILEQNRVAYSSRDKMTELLAELYSPALESGKGPFQTKRIQFKDRTKFFLPDEIFFMTDKHMSQIVSIAEQKEKEIRMSQALGSLEASEKTEGICPEWIRDLLTGYGFQPPKDAEQAKKFLRGALRTQKQRCHLVQREDLLPLIHYVAQKRYDKMQREQGMDYQCEDARIFFIQMADEILTECQMAPVSEAYQLDYLLLFCYMEEDMYSLADIIEAAEKEETGYIQKPENAGTAFVE